MRIRATLTMDLQVFEGESWSNNAVNIERLQKDMEKVLADVEKLKDKIRSVKNGHTIGE